MKFAHSLQFNAVPEWSDSYINYSSLKKLIYKLAEESTTEEGSSFTANEPSEEPSRHEILQKKLADKIRRGKGFVRKDKASQVSARDSADELNVETIELESNRPRHVRIFIEKLDAELEKIDKFYKTQEAEVYSQVEETLKELKRYTETPFSDQSKRLSHDFDDDETDQYKSSDVDLERGIRHIDNVEEEEELIHSSLLNDLEMALPQQQKITFKKQSIHFYIELSQLKSFIELNRLGFSKVCKKFDKVLQAEIKAGYMSSLADKTYIFKRSTLAKLDSYMEEITRIYGIITENASFDLCSRELKSFLREHIVWERNTVWKDLIGLERQTQEAKVGSESDLQRLDCFEYLLPDRFHINTKWVSISKLKIPKCLFGKRAALIALVILVTGILLGVKTFNDEQQHNCMALLACCAILWATEAIPLWVTSMLVPFLTVLFQVLKNDDGTKMNAADAATYIFSTMWGSVIMLLLGGFTLAAALSKYNIAKVLSSYILAMAGTKPRNILLAIMAVAAFLSMWLSNVAAPVLTYSLAQPVLKTIPYDSGFAKALILGVALASDVAGMSSPISSPQNIIAIQALDPQPSWGNWFSVSIPCTILGVLVIWVEMVLTFKMKDVQLKKIKPIRESFTLKQWYICAVTVGTIILWCLMTKLDGVFGQSGIISILPMALFFGTGLLSTQDVNNYPWSIVLLAMGGIALGKAVTSSGLLKTIADALDRRIENYSAWEILIIFGVLVLVFATFVSHTVAALIIIPLVQKIGENLPTPHPQLMVIGTALLASVAMGLPTSGFPNVTAISMTDDMGNRYLDVGTFISRGVPGSLMVFVIVITVGYGIMITQGF
ncbi:unnamed protein product [Kuraishia capsulata CBS 1993]|uniref:SPX domain-containing protein n=1 Tax=Kuraishia capsulata CBS 1993 TaxID=1382522 RepID=W6MTM6_9ASCO|nr:uncharacterized protein KUCA_T00004530001 [Kuraishia capsulata CBS 1993]CDK28547.1 unnamed protein product [Kuraishia capsulata CBS 1993]